MATVYGVTPIVEFDWDFDGTYTAETNQLDGEGVGGFSFSRREDDDGVYQGSQCNITLRSVSARYNYLNPTNGPIQPRVPVRIRATVDGTATTYTLWTGYIADFDGPNYDLGIASSSYITFYCLDLLGMLLDDEATVEVDQDVVSDDAYESLLTSAGIASGDYSITTGLQTFPTFFHLKGPLGRALQDVVDSECGGHHRCRADGDIVFEPRSTRLGTTSTATLGTGNYVPVSVRSEVRNTVYDRASVETTTYGDYAAATTPTEVFKEFLSLNANIYGGATIKVPAASALGPTKLEPTIWAGQPNGSTAIIPVTITGDTPVCAAKVDYLANDTGASGGTDKTADLTVTFEKIDGAWHFTRTNTSASDIYIYRFSIRAIIVAPVQTHGAANKTTAGTTASSSARTAGTAWTTPGNATSSNDSYATAGMTSPNDSEDLLLTNWGFTADDFAQGGTITGVIVAIEGKTSTSTDGLTVRLVKGGTIQTNGTNSVTLTTTEAIHECGGTAELFGATLTVDDVIDSGFGVAICVDTGITATYSVDHVTVTIYYSLPPTNFQGSQSFDLSVPLVPSTLKGGKKKAAFRLPWVSNANIARDYAYSRLREYRYPEEKIIAKWIWKNDSARATFAQVELGQQYTYNDSALTNATGNNDLYRVSGIVTTWVVGRPIETELTLRPSYNFRNHDKIAWDDFNRADNGSALGNTPTGKAWTIQAGSWSISSKKARGSSVGLARVLFDLGASDVIAEVSLSNLSADTDEIMGVVVRYSDSSNYWRLQVSDALDTWALIKTIAGATTAVATGAWTPTDTCELRVIARGSSWKCWIDRKLVGTATDSALSTATTVGFLSAATSTSEFDNCYFEGL